jgi:hypothetical protein
MKTNDKQTMTLADGASGGDRSLRFRTRDIGRLAAWPVLAAAMLTAAACGDDGSGGNEDTLFTGLSGVVILGAAVWFILRKIRSRG